MAQPPMPPATPPATPEPMIDSPPSATEPPPYFPLAEDAKPDQLPPPAKAPPEEFGWRKSTQPLNKHFKLLSPLEEMVATPAATHELIAAVVVVTSDDQRVSAPHPFFPILPVDVVLPNDGWEPYEPRVPGIIIRARGDWAE